MGQYAGFGSADEANARLRALLEQGQTGFSVALDLPTQMGLDSDHPLAAGEVGKVGVAIDTVDDLDALFAGIDLASVRQIRTTANAIGPIWLAMVSVMAETRGIDPNDIAILIQNDILKEYFARGTYFLPPRPAVSLVVDTIEYCAEHLPNWTPVAISGYHIREAGATAAQEIAFSFSDGLAYCEGALARGLHIDSFAPSLFTFLSSGTDVLEEVAKFRAARTVWAESMARLGAVDPRSQALSIFAFTAGSSLTAQQPMNNVARVTGAALAAVLGGCQTLHTAAYDEALGTPTAASAELALRVQQVILHEFGVAGTVDPLGGSWAVEALTAELTSQIYDQMAQVDDQGGAVACVESGWFSQRITDQAYEDMQQVDSGERVVVGVNAFVDSSSDFDIEAFRGDPRAEEMQRQRLDDVRRTRSSTAVQAALDEVRDAARAGVNCVPSIIGAVRERATVGEICDILRDVHGTYRPPTTI
jgi:methylmalonyl-CoA mutase N-terminal domain/subunit